MMVESVKEKEKEKLKIIEILKEEVDFENDVTERNCIMQRTKCRKYR